MCEMHVGWGVGEREKQQEVFESQPEPVGNLHHQPLLTDGRTTFATQAGGSLSLQISLAS